MHEVYNDDLVENEENGEENGEEEQKFRWEVRDTNTPAIFAENFLYQI